MKHSVKLLTLSALTALVACANEGPNVDLPPAVISQPAAQQAPAQPVANNAQPATAATLISVATAIQTAESHSKAVAREIELHQGMGNPVYDVETHKGTQEHRIQIDAVTGQVLSSYSERDVNVQPSPKVTLANAVQIALQAAPGQLIDAKLDDEMINAKYEIKILATNNQPYELHVDASSGKITRSRVEYDD